MIKKKTEYKSEVREKMRGGEGKVTIEKLWEPGDEIKAKNRLFAKLILSPGSSIGFHKHENEEEIFVILNGTAEVDDDGVRHRLEKGDSILTGHGKGHSIRSVGDCDLEVMAVITMC